jgi:hypothetical protein
MGCCLFNSLLLPNLLVVGRFATRRKADDLESDEDDDTEDDWSDYDEPSDEDISLPLAA